MTCWAPVKLSPLPPLEKFNSKTREDASCVSVFGALGFARIAAVDSNPAASDPRVAGPFGSRGAFEMEVSGDEWGGDGQEPIPRDSGQSSVHAPKVLIASVMACLVLGDEKTTLLVFKACARMSSKSCQDEKTRMRACRECCRIQSTRPTTASIYTTNQQDSTCVNWNHITGRHAAGDRLKYPWQGSQAYQCSEEVLSIVRSWRH